jgi:methylglutaconyl-CoA hydratase
MADFQHVTIEAGERIARITLNRPEKANALNYVVVQELKTALVAADNDPSVKVVVIKAAGPTFCAGLDLEYLYKLQQYGVEENLYDARHVAELYLLMAKMHKIVIVQVEGPALATGCGLVAAADFAYATPQATFGFREVKMGFIPSLPIKTLIRKIGEGRTRQLLLSGDIVGAHTAADFGLIAGVTENENIENYVLYRALQFCKENSQSAIEVTKRLIHDTTEMPFDDALTFSIKMSAHARMSLEARFGTQCYITGQAIEW